MTALRTPWDAEPAAADLSAPDLTPGPESKPKPKPRGRRPASSRRTAAGVPSWLYHHLVVTGPADGVALFVTAARGPGVIAWATDGAEVEEWVFNLAASQPPARRNLTMAGCRILARQYRERFEAHHERAAEQMGHRRSCALDLHALLPVPDDILRLGRTHPAALAWCRTHWGVPDGLHQAGERPDLGPGRRLPRGHGVAAYGFFTGGDTPHVAVAGLAARWPGLRFVLRPRPD